MTRNQAYRRLSLVLFIFILLSTAYSILHPLQHGPDELAHFKYSRFIAQHYHLPQTYEERDQAGYLSFWPPLFHGTAAIFSAWIDDDVPSNIREVSASAITNSEDEYYPYRGDVLRWHVGRFTSVIFGAGIIVVAFFTALALGPGRYRLAVVSAAIIACVPAFVLVSGSMSYETLAGLLIGLYFLVLIKIAKGDARLRNYILVGLFMGLAVMAKYAAIILPVEVVTVLAYLAWRYRWGWQGWLKGVGVAALVSIMVSGWWFLFLVANFGEFEEYGPVIGSLKPIVAGGIDASQNYTAALLTGGKIGSTDSIYIKPQPFSAWVWRMYQDMWATYLDQYAIGLPAFIFVGFIYLIAAIGLIKTWRCYQNRRVWIALLAYHILLFFMIPLLRFSIQGNIGWTAQGRHVLFPAATVLPLFLIYGWPAWLSLKAQRFLALTIVGGLISWTLAQLILVATYYDPPIPVRKTAYIAGEISNPLNQPFGDDWLLLKGYNSELLPDRSALKLELYWQSLTHINQDYLRKVTLVKDGQTWLDYTSYPTDGVYRTNCWEALETIRDEINLPLFELATGTYQAQVQLYDESGPLQTEGKDSLIVTEITIPNQPPVETDIPLSINVAGREVLNGLKLWQPRRAKKTGLPEYHPGMALPFIWQDYLASNQQLEWFWVDPNGAMYPTRQHAPHFRSTLVNSGPPVNLDASIEMGWPPGNYRLRAEVWQNSEMLAFGETEPLITVVNDRPRLMHPPPVPDSLEANFANQIKLLGYHLPERSFTAEQPVPVTLYWQGLQNMDKSFTVFAKLLDYDQKQAWGSADRLPADGYPTQVWWKNEVVVDGFELPMAPNIPPGIYWLNVGLYFPLNQTGISLPLMVDGQPTDITSVTIGPIKVGDPPPAAVLSPAEINPDTPLSLALGDPPVILLRGYTLTDKNGQPITNTRPEQSRRNQLPITNYQLTLYWESLAPTPVNWSIFVHMRNRTGQTVAQKDGPAGGTGDIYYPTSLWAAGEAVSDKIDIPVPPDLPPGEYSLVVGLYNLADGRRLPVPDSANQEIILTTQKFTRP